MLNHILEILTIGLPFCAFKIITGLYLRQYWLVALGAIDLLINGMNLLSLLVLRRRISDACFLSLLIRLLRKPNPQLKHKWQDLGNALDVLLSFGLVALMIGTGYIGQIPSMHGDLWNLSVILNVLGAGYNRLALSIKNLHVDY